ncbi:oxygen-independent coproporphyrinogen III oxidase [Oecophyllibacter saccharovorans]|uniref:oxygen-independent coproporphyrinogen III oxidase n=1 Tax=Oecophyllibacter saccharovorans TaxID=2558360 RepID=UPI0011700232|nr:oxygen-independent coproporphyrinogen III oxidase [Oecophyllibacter saccharovorans]TPW35222.1 oxygen-independent coproporphyrinogen III oxidase [Oecophyllibacter saccharovorans]
MSASSVPFGPSPAFTPDKPASAVPREAGFDSARQKALLARYSGQLPRYTSYPTAVQFTEATGSATLAGWLEDLAPGASFSLYFHVPFCDELCSFCACNTSVVRHEERRLAYGRQLLEEVARVGQLTGPGHPVTHLHWGGGTPTSLPAESLRAVMAAARAQWPLTPDAEVSIELDPRNVPPGCGALLAELGFNRVSLGVQDIDPEVQKAAGRIQSRAQTEACIAEMRGAGIASVNIDLIYGLPRQTTESVTRTAHSIAALRPDRLAVFGYAHVPWKEKRQKLIDENLLPDSDARFEQREAIDRVLREAGYVVVGLDHYALPSDSMARALEDGTLRRNFQGYTTDDSDILVGLGASAISAFPQGLTQNAVSAAAYRRALTGEDGVERTGGLPTWRGVTRRGQDRLRAAVIEQLMIFLQVDLAAQCRRFNAEEDFAAERAALAPMVADGLVTVEGDVVRVPEGARLFVRNVAAVFDQHLRRDGVARHSSAV